MVNGCGGELVLRRAPHRPTRQEPAAAAAKGHRMRITKMVRAAGLLCLSLSFAEPAAGQDAAADAGKVAEIKVLEPGAAPRRELRYQFRKGAVETMVMDMTMSMRMTVNGQQVPAMDMPTMRMAMRLETVELLPGGD